MDRTLKVFKSATAKDVGSTMICGDASYFEIMNNAQSIEICGNEVQILGSAFRLKFKPEGPRKKPIIREFIKVAYKGQTYIILNIFKR